MKVCFYHVVFIFCYRINEIFNHSELKITVITTTRLFTMLAAMVLLDILLLVYMQVIKLKCRIHAYFALCDRIFVWNYFVFVQVTAPLKVSGVAMTSEFRYVFQVRIIGYVQTSLHFTHHNRQLFICGHFILN